MKHHLLGLLILGCTACLPQKYLRQRREREEQQQSSTTHVDSQRMEIHIERLTLETEQNQVYAELWPSGEFRYSPELGFVGRATKVQLHQKREQVQQSRDSSNLLVRQGQQVYQQESNRNKERYQMRHKEIEGSGTWLYPALGLILLAVLLLLYLKHFPFRRRK